MRPMLIENTKPGDGVDPSGVIDQLKMKPTAYCDPSGVVLREIMNAGLGFLTDWKRKGATPLGSIPYSYDIVQRMFDPAGVWLSR